MLERKSLVELLLLGYFEPHFVSNCFHVERSVPHFKYDVPVESDDWEEEASDPEVWRLAHVPEDGVEHVTGRYGREEVLVYDAEQEPEPYAPPHRYVSPFSPTIEF